MPSWRILSGLRGYWERARRRSKKDWVAREGPAVALGVFRRCDGRGGGTEEFFLSSTKVRLPSKVISRSSARIPGNIAAVMPERFVSIFGFDGL